MLDEKREQFEKQVRRLLSDPDGRKAVGDALGLEVKFSEDLKDKPIVAVLVASLRGFHPKMMDSLTQMLAYSKSFCTVYLEPVRAGSLISWVRNDLLAELYRSGKKFTHVLWVDDDMVLRKDYLVRMLRADKDVIGCVYTHRVDPPVPNLHLLELKTGAVKRILHWKTEGVKSSGDENSTLSLGTGLLLIKKEVTDRIAQFYVDCEYERATWGLTDEQTAHHKAVRAMGHKANKNGFWFQLLPRLSGAGETGEDTSICLKAALCGFTVWVDTEIRPGHVGEYEYGYEDFLAFTEQGKQKAEAEGGYVELE
jgi:hypothetical protein